MNFEFYHSKTPENEISYWMSFLKSQRGIKNFPDIPAGEVRTLAWHDGQEICFKRIGLRVGQLIIKRIGELGAVVKTRPLFPYVMYFDGEPEDKLKLVDEALETYNEEIEEIRQQFHAGVREGIVPFT